MLDHHLRSRRSVLAILATEEYRRAIAETLGGEATLLFAEGVEEARSLISGGDAAVLLVFGDQAAGAELAGWMQAASLPGPRPRVMYFAEVGPAIRESTERACAEFAAARERDALALALARERRASHPSAQLSAPTRGTALWGVRAVGGTQEVDALAPRYLLHEAVGEGGAGTVFSCTDTRLGRRVAMKVLHERLVDKPEFVAMLEREARITGVLEHSSIVPVYDVGRTPDGAPFYVMKYVEHSTLREVVTRLAAGEAGAVADYSLGRLLRLFIQICHAVDCAHSHRVIHCDLKPENVLIGSFGEVLLVDWGLAYLQHEHTVFRGGTLGFVAPEQMTNDRIDARTDVYALGSILYDLLCLKRTFEETDYGDPTTGELRHPQRLPPPLRTVAPDRGIAEELEEICLRALQPQPDERQATAGELAAAIDGFLEGTKEHERRQRRAAELFDEAESMSANYFELVASRPERLAELDRQRGAVAPWDPPEKKQALWDAEDGLAIIDTLSVRTMQSAAALFEQALLEVRTHRGARRGLARLYEVELRRAEERGDEHDRAYFEQLVAQYDNGEIAQLRNGGGTLLVECQGGTAEIQLATIEEQGRRLVAAASQVLGRNRIDRLPIAQGQYLVTLHAPGLEPIRFPLMVKPDREVRIFANLDEIGPGAPGEILIPGGSAVLERHPATPSEGELRREVHVESFFLQELPVSFGEYLEFVLNSWSRLDQTEREALLPRNGLAGPLWRLTGKTFEPAEIAQYGKNRETLLELPVFGVDLACAQAYARWKARRTGLTYRLPTELEWEKAARGVDGRRYPWGNQFDASFCSMREARPGQPRPAARGAFPADVSPFGVRDLGGGVADWTTPAAAAELMVSGRAVTLHGTRAGRANSELASRGGAWCDWANECLATARRPYPETDRPARVGFRLARSGPASTGYTVRDGDVSTRSAGR